MKPPIKIAKNTVKNIAIIGAGPCGLMAAEMLATAGHLVTIYDRMPSPARKFLMAGRGGLNLTHSEPLEKFIARYGAAAKWLAPSIHNFPPDALRAWCHGLGQESFVGSSGRVFPRSMKAAPLLRAWLRRLENLGVRYVPRHTWHGWKDSALHFSNDKNEAVLVSPDATLLALGGASWPRLGSDGKWTDILSAQGIKIAPLIPSNCGFIVEWSDYFKGHFAGMPLKPVLLTHNGVAKQGEVMITEQGIEGGLIYAFSASLRDEIAMRGSATILLDLRPSMTLEALTKKLQAPRANKSLSTFLRGVGFSPLAIALLHESAPNEKLAQLSANELAIKLKYLPVTLIAPTAIERAISSAGGIVQDELTADFMLRAKAGVFAAGEMLDWEAPTGGYLLQACFSTAVSAARGIMRYLEAQEE